jgi:hypothetical protein
MSRKSDSAGNGFMAGFMTGVMQGIVEVTIDKTTVINCPYPNPASEVVAMSIATTLDSYILRATDFFKEKTHKFEKPVPLEDFQKTYKKESKFAIGLAGIVNANVGHHIGYYASRFVGEYIIR